jgi:4-hydroxybutyrate CoA-transferase
MRCRAIDHLRAGKRTVEHVTRKIEADAIAELLAPGMRVYVAGGSNEPRGIIDALKAHPQAADGVTFVQFPLPGMNTTDFTALHPNARMQVYFLTPDLRAAFADGRAELIPMQMRLVFDHLKRGAPFDLALVQFAGTGAHGYVPGPCVDFLEAALVNARFVVAQVNERLPHLAESPVVPRARVDFALHSSIAPPEYPAAQADDVARAIGDHVASLVNDGACIQTGIGAIPAAVLDALGEKNDLGVHSGLIDDRVMGLTSRGVITGRRKSIDRDLITTGMALGSAELYEWLHERAGVRFAGVDHTHEISVIRELDDFVSINSAVEIDLYGQVSAEMVAARQLSGTGGALDFMRGARASRGGKSVIALSATARGREVSRIVAELPAGTALTAPRTDVDYVVTEHGIAHLYGRSLDARANALIEIAAPEFRETLRAAWRAK